MHSSREIHSCESECQRCGSRGDRCAPAGERAPHSGADDDADAFSARDCSRRARDRAVRFGHARSARQTTGHEGAGTVRRLFAEQRTGREQLSMESILKNAKPHGILSAGSRRCCIRMSGWGAWRTTSADGLIGAARRGRGRDQCAWCWRCPAPTRLRGRSRRSTFSPNWHRKAVGSLCSETDSRPPLFTAKP